ncbi:MAG: ATP-binding cassette domain-containing protein [Synechococcales cyanobacterium RM1_1_8]|nr:ATP-binding cassette domain-containing protein [Synechococcales cyanobacterium RM1_1_8]
MGLLVLEQVGLEQFPGRSALGQSALGQSALGQSALGQSAQRSPAPISFSLAGGEMALLLGAPGSGKTRLLRLINGLQSPSQGQIFWQGKAQADYSPLALRRQIAWLPSQPQLLGMAVGEAIAYPLKLQGLPNSTIQPRLEQWLEILEIPTAWLGRSPPSSPWPKPSRWPWPAPWCWSPSCCCWMIPGPSWEPIRFQQPGPRPYPCCISAALP